MASPMGEIRNRLRRKHSVQNQLLANSLAAGQDPNMASVSPAQTKGVKLPRIMRIQTPDGNILESSEPRTRNYLKKNPRAKILGYM